MENDLLTSRIWIHLPRFVLVLILQKNFNESNPSIIFIAPDIHIIKIV